MSSPEPVDKIAGVIFHGKPSVNAPKILLVEDDVDITDLSQVVWAFATRSHPDVGRGEFHYQPAVSDQLAVYLSPGEARSFLAGKVVYNCLLADIHPEGQATRQRELRKRLARTDPGTRPDQLDQVRVFPGTMSASIGTVRGRRVLLLASNPAVSRFWWSELIHALLQPGHPRAPGSASQLATPGRPAGLRPPPPANATTSSDAASTASSSSALSLPDSTKPRLPTEAWPTWPRCAIGRAEARVFGGRRRPDPLRHGTS
ncbi:UbiD family decarboxylase domain-containing protein [Amycolatopsis australiensis]|uniref:UbiD family decarboxylase domain-containing protein n=1 Tax=Amycolatopsis australiensis TaxID=546364 RepID=UPI0015A6816B|nr:UbiD family decarboxylase domain-containing protein [Amycolatopsis australiensis]